MVANAEAHHQRRRAPLGSPQGAAAAAAKATVAPKQGRLQKQKVVAPDVSDGPSQPKDPLSELAEGDAIEVQCSLLHSAAGPLSPASTAQV